jgi:hypothetical protein
LGAKDALGVVEMFVDSAKFLCVRSMV